MINKFFRIFTQKDTALNYSEKKRISQAKSRGWNKYLSTFLSTLIHTMGIILKDNVDNSCISVG